MPLSFWLGKYVHQQEDLIKKEEDALSTIVGEWVSNVRLLRFLGWEALMRTRIAGHIRQLVVEATRQHGVNLINFGVSVTWWLFPIIALIWADEAFGGDQDLVTLFASIWMLNHITLYIRWLPDIFISYAAASVCVKRLGKLFQHRDISDDQLPKCNHIDIGSKPVKLHLLSVSFHYESDEKWVLREINLEIDLRQRISLIGSVGSGKSTLLKLICAEMKPSTGTIEVDFVFSLYGKQKNLLERIHAGYAVLVYGFLVYGLHSGLITVTLAAVVITAVFNLNNIFFGLAWDMSFLGETASHARRAFFIIDLPDETTEESSVIRVKSKTQVVARLRGDICFVNYSMSFRPDSKVILDDLSLTIPEGMKVGIVGRTGAGKSSLMQALFRMVYHRQGDITVGGQSIFDVEVNDLRSQFGVVPQDPYLFMGSIRFNLMGELTDLSDRQLEMALRTVGLEVDLDAQVLEGGKDYSVGERQLLCLARLVLLDKQYILMDEPTSSLDRRTDEHIQRLLETELAEKMVVTIAHRLESLEHYDLILEMADGRLLRQGPPNRIMPLIRNQYVDERVV